MAAKNFISKLSDCDAENSETNVWIDFALACNYINHESHQKLSHQKLSHQKDEVGRLLYHMINNPEKY
jgi:four helix bundle protein